MHKYEFLFVLEAVYNFPMTLSFRLSVGWSVGWFHSLCYCRTLICTLYAWFIYLYICVYENPYVGFICWEDKQMKAFVDETQVFLEGLTKLSNGLKR